MSTSQVIFYILGSILSLFGGAYTLRGKLLPYHERYLGIRQRELPPKMAGLAAHSIRMIGGFLIGNGAAVLLLAHLLFLEYPHVVKMIILGLVAPGLVFMGAAAVSVRQSTPRIAVGLLTSLLILGIIF